MESKPTRIALPVTYIVDELRRTLSGGPLQGGAGQGVRGVQFSSASHGLNAVPCQFVLPLEAAQKGLFFRPQSLGPRTHVKFENINNF